MKAVLAFVSYLMVSSFAVSADNRETILAAADVIEQLFFDKSVGQQVAKKISEPDFIEQFSTIEDKEQFTEQFSQALRAISGDNHIGIIFSPQDVKRYQIREQAKAYMDSPFI